MARISRTHLLASVAEGLTRAASGPEPRGAWHSCDGESEGPASNSSEEMALGISSKFMGSHVVDGAVINVSRRDASLGDEFTQPRDGTGVVVIVVVQAEKSFAIRSRSSRYFPW